MFFKPWSKRRRLDEMESSEMMDEIFELIGTGALYFNQAQRLCRASCRDHGGNAAEAVQAFATLGASGNASQNIERDAFSWLKNMFGTGLQPSQIQLYLQSSGRISAEWENVAVLSIHEVFSAVFHAGSDQQNLSLWGGNGDSKLREFWKNAMAHVAWAKNHPATQGRSVEELAKIFPIVIFVDGVEVFTNNEFVMWCWAVHTTAGNGDSWDTRFPIIAIEKNRMRDADVRMKCHADIANFIAWEMEVMESKVFPI